MSATANIASFGDMTAFSLKESDIYHLNLEDIAVIISGPCEGNFRNTYPAL